MPVRAGERENRMKSEFGEYINQLRKGRGPGGEDVLLRDLAEAMGGISLPYLSDILKGRRNPPEKNQLLAISKALSMTREEEDRMMDLAGRERQQTAPDLTDVIMDEDMPYVRVALRTAHRKGLGNAFWKQIVDQMNAADEENAEEDPEQ
ncbi:MAG: helix-turn-helix transcriptional regulator [Clostridia bacterium]|nr:helix-turn-helix transcriptional regulator [Clostridia bacterium]